jgi:hypothetical protein
MSRLPQAVIKEGIAHVLPLNNISKNQDESPESKSERVRVKKE